jgi:light-independent protochlorophyllide reductase subunit B
MGIRVNVCAPYDATPEDITRLAQAHFNVLMYPETGEAACRWMERNWASPSPRSCPIGVGATRDFVAEVAQDHRREPRLDDDSRLRLPWYSASVDSTYLTGKRVFLFGDGTHVAAAARIARDEMGFEVVGLGCYNREQARMIRALAKEYGVEALITDDYLEVEAHRGLAPEMILGTQMERHIGKRLGIPCAVISAPVHVQDFPARYSPQMGIEGANVIFDTWVHPLVMGLEEHLLHMFREDFEFHDEAGASHHGGKAELRALDARPRAAEPEAPAAAPASADSTSRSSGCPRRKGAQEDPVLRARQGAAQHRSLRRRREFPRSA